jgi:hypothetical protein
LFDFVLSFFVFLSILDFRFVDFVNSAQFN